MNSNLHHKLYCAVDIGGTKMLLCLINENRDVLYKEKFPTPPAGSPGEVVDAMHRVLHKALSSREGLSLELLRGVGVCIAAFTDFERGIVYQAPNIGWTQPVALRDLLAARYACPVCVENDTNAAVLGEARFGAAQGHDHVAYITISTGIGAGLLLGGKIYRGSRGFAGEIGHVKTFGRGRRCGCGGMDCLESWASGTGIATSARALWKEKAHTPLDAAWVFGEAAAGNPLAQKIIDEAVTDIATALANLVNLLNPTCLVLGGGVVASRRDLLERIRQKIAELAIRPSVENTPLVVEPARLEPEAGIWGMYALMRESDL